MACKQQNKSEIRFKILVMKTYKLVVTEVELGYIHTALLEKAWASRKEPAGKYYRELNESLKEQARNQ